MSGAKPKISVILPAYNRAEVMRFAIQSVRQSDFSDWELLVVGDACTDNTEAVVQSFDDPRIRFSNLEHNSGGQSAPNIAALAQAQGEIVLFLNQDDMYFADHLSATLRHFETTGADFVWSPVILLRRSGLESGPPDPRHDQLDLGGAVGAGGYDPAVFVIGSSMALTRAAATRIGPWRDAADLHLLPSQDWIFRASQAGLELSYRPGISVLCILAGNRRFSYLKTASPEHDRAWSWIADLPGADAALLECLAVNLAAARHHKAGVSETHGDPETVDRDLLNRVARRLGLHPQETRARLLRRPKGFAIDRIRGLTAGATRLAVGQELPLGGNAAAAYLDDNWHRGEENGRWTSAATADLVFDPQGADGPLSLRLGAVGSRRPETVTFLVNDQPALTHRFAGFETVSVPLGPVSGTTRLTLQVADPASPQELGTGSDRRRLGVWVTTVTLVAGDPG